MQKYLTSYFQCQQHHEPMNLVCLDQNCLKRGIICPHCEYQNHKHPVKALRMLMVEVEDDMKIYESCLSLLSQIDLAYVQITQEINKIANPAQKKSVTEMATNYFEYNVGTLFKRSKIVKQYENLEEKTVQKMNQFIIKYNFVDKALNPNNYSNTEYQIRTRLEELNGSLKQIKEAVKNNESFNAMMKIFQVDDNKRIKYFYNSEKCHKDIIIVDKTKVELKEGYSYRIGLIDPPIRKQSGKIKKKSITFKITKVTALVGIGVVYKKKAETANYLFSAYSQHGCYFITNSGYTYNQSNPNYNSQIKNWNFTTNDIIKVTVEPKQKKILFQKQGKDVFELPFEQKPDLELNFGVLLCQQHESVEIMYV